MRIRRKSAAGLQLAAEIFQLMRADTPLDKRARIDTWRCVPLKINRVTLEFVGAPAEEMIEAHLIQSSRRSISRNMPADIVFDAICAHYHGQRVPPNQALDAAFEFLISREKRLQARGDSVR